jgi:DnaJ-domain-containing protein 1
MSTCTAESDVAANLLERRWFASMAAARVKQAECEALLEVMSLAKASWHDSRAELVKLEALRDALAEQLAEQTAEQTAERRAIREQFQPVRAERVWSAA